MTRSRGKNFGVMTEMVSAVPARVVVPEKTPVTTT
jgi:hypothetical protein